MLFGDQGKIFLNMIIKSILADIFLELKKTFQSSLFSISERIPTSSTSTPKHKSRETSSTSPISNPKFKIPESEITGKLNIFLIFLFFKKI